MKKFFTIIYRSVIKPTFITVLVLLFLQLCIDTSLLRKQITSSDLTQSESTLTIFKALYLIVEELGAITETQKETIEQLESIAEQQEYIIDQNRSDTKTTRVITTITNEEQKKPSYESLRAHNVFVMGCAGRTLDVNKNINFPIGEEGKCWRGTGVVIKITDTETYILTNNHVSGKGEEDVHLYVKNGNKKAEATIVAQHKYVDAAVIKVETKLIDKVAIPGISSVYIQDPIYIVGNPLGVKNVYSEGVVAGYKGIDLLIQVPCIYGSSGSGVFDKEGNLVGLIYALEDYQGWMGIPEARITHSLAVDSVSIKSFLVKLGLYNEL